MKRADIPQPFKDESRLGQSACARIAIEVNTNVLNAVVSDVLCPRYCNEEWRAMQTRRLKGALSEIAHAEAVLAHYGNEVAR